MTITKELIKMTDKKIEYKVHISNPLTFKLYRYRPINEYTIEQLKNFEFYLTSVDKFNDPYDCTFLYDEDSMIDFYTQLRNINMKDILLKDNISREDFKILNDNIYMQFHRKSFAVASLTEKNDNEIMWAHYADNAKGFCIEYSYKNLSKLLTDDIVLNSVNEYNLKTFGFPIMLKGQKLKSYIKDTFCDLVPVFYTDDKLTLDFINGSLDLNSIVHGIPMIKNADWSYENEWRIVFSIMGLKDFINKSYFTIGKLKPDKIFLGEFVSKENLMLMEKISLEYNIDLYVMRSQQIGLRRKLIPHKIEKPR